MVPKLGARDAGNETWNDREKPIPDLASFKGIVRFIPAFPAERLQGLEAKPRIRSNWQLVGGFLKNSIYFSVLEGRWVGVVISWFLNTLRHRSQEGVGTVTSLSTSMVEGGLLESRAPGPYCDPFAVKWLGDLQTHPVVGAVVGGDKHWVVLEGFSNL